MSFNEDELIRYRQPTTIEERLVIAADFVEHTDYSIPLVVDTIDDPALDAYAAWPERLYGITPDGRIAFKGGVGPFFYSVSRLESWLEDELARARSSP